MFIILNLVSFIGSVVGYEIYSSFDLSANQFYQSIRRKTKAHGQVKDKAFICIGNKKKGRNAKEAINIISNKLI